MTKLLSWVFLVVFSAGLCLGVGELMVRRFDPQVVLYPRWEYSPEYGLVLPKNAKMVHELPGQWRFVYSTNEDAMRGEWVPLTNRFDVPNIVVLGDSYAFGSGVNDGEEFPARLIAELGGRYRVVNTAVGGYGLTQQIRRFYELGLLYEPFLVILQFCSNDPSDNFVDQVTQIEDGRFVFRSSELHHNAVQQWLSKSALLQRSQLYSFVRSRYDGWRQREGLFTQQLQRGPQREAATRAAEEEFYNRLLEMFAVDLDRRGIALLMISVTNQLEAFPAIREKVRTLDEAGLIDYREVADWLEPGRHYASPEGHVWGARAHDIIGRRLAEIIRQYPVSVDSIGFLPDAQDRRRGPPSQETEPVEGSE